MTRRWVFNQKTLHIIIERLSWPKNRSNPFASLTQKPRKGTFDESRLVAFFNRRQGSIMQTSNPTINTGTDSDLLIFFSLTHSHFLSQ